jgi:hypothetical protein
LTDENFASFVRDCAGDAAGPAELQTLLRDRYPQTVVRSRDLSGETTSVWYVYRDGRWSPPEASAAERPND